MRRVLMLITALAALVSVAQAQAPSAIVEHYQAYLAALEAGDTDAAEAAAVAALAASEAQDGDSGRTAVLATNLAVLRLDLGRGADALAPAERAHEIAAARGAESGVDPLAADLVFGRAKLAAGDADGARFVRDALNRARTRTDVAASAYEAAVALAQYAFAEGRFRTAREAFGDADRHADGAVDPVFARAVARVGLGASMLMTSANQRRALMIIDEAARTLRPYSVASTPTDPLPGELTEAEFAFATALAWRGAGQQLLVNAGQSDPTWTPRGRPDTSQAFTAGCRADVLAGEVEDLPPSTLRRAGVSAAVVLLETDEAGAATRRTIVATAPSDAARVALQRDLDDWGIRWAEDADPACRAKRRIFLVVTLSH